MNKVQTLYQIIEAKAIIRFMRRYIKLNSNKTYKKQSSDLYNIFTNKTVKRIKK